MVALKKKNQIRIRFSTTFKSGLIPIRKCQKMFIDKRLVLFTLPKANRIWVTYERKNQNQVTCNGSLNVAFEILNASFKFQSVVSKPKCLRSTSVVKLLYVCHKGA